MSPLLLIFHGSPCLWGSRFALGNTPFNLLRPIDIAFVKPEVERLVHVNVLGSSDTIIFGQRCMDRHSATNERCECEG